MEYEILTKRKVFDVERDWEDENYLAYLTEEQDILLEELGYSWKKAYRMSVCGIEMETDINDAIERLAIKDGADLVRFENGNIGFVAYYNCIPLSENYMEIYTS